MVTPPTPRSDLPWLSVSLLALLLFSGCQSLPICTAAPPRPDGGPSDWEATVRNNCFENLERLGRWVGGTRALANGDSPAFGFLPVAAASVGAEEPEPISVYVLVHGWAPGYRSNVEAAGGFLQWWSKETGNADGVWPSNWAWVPTTTSDPALSVTATGVFQELQLHDSNAIVLGYSWTDESGTDGSFTTLDQVYRSEAYTNVNGLRLAAALEEALAPRFWQGKDNRLHIIGHSHGSKVATVATLTLQERGRRVDQLTVLDSPETKITLTGNGANLLGFYLDQLSIAPPAKREQGQVFVDNYVSRFGVVLTGSEMLSRIIDVALDPSELYSFDEAGDQHSYAAAWYGGAAVGAAAQQPPLPPVGLDWPPFPTDLRQAFNQRFENGASERGQWTLDAGDSIDEVRRFAIADDVDVSTVGTSGNVTVSPAGDVTLSATGKKPFSTAVYQGNFDVSIFSDVFGVAFDLEWTQPADGGYLVFTVESPDLRFQEVILVVDGKSRIEGKHPMAFNADISDADFFIYYIPATGNDGGSVTVSNFRGVISECEDNCFLASDDG